MSNSSPSPPRPGSGPAPGSAPQTASTPATPPKPPSKPWPAAAKPSPQKSANTTTTSNNSAPRSTQLCSQPPASAPKPPLLSSSPPATTHTGSAAEPPSPLSAAPRPVPASSGKTGTRHRLNRGGNRQANRALWTIAVNRLRSDPRTQTYRNRRRAQGKTNPEIIRCLKRYIANEIHTLLTNPPPTPDPQQLRALRQQARITLQTAAHHLQTTPTRLSQLERGLHHDTTLTTRYHTWLTTQQPN